MQNTIMNDISSWSSWLQRRVMRLMLLHDVGLFKSQFRTFFLESTLPQIPLLQQYDRYIKLALLSNELLDDILPRIRRQLSLQTDSARLLEESPTRGDIDWRRTSERTLREAPGLPPTRFDTRLRQRSTTTPENLLTVAVLLAYREELQRVQREELGDEKLSEQERRVLISADERAERELAAAYARALIDEASHCDIEALADRVASRLRPGTNPYQDLIDWWQRFRGIAIGRNSGARRLVLASQRDDEKTDAWLYEIWIALELLHLLHEAGAIQSSEMMVECDRLQCLFTWKGRRFRFRYNRQREESAGPDAGWEHGPTSRPDYTIEREHPLRVPREGLLVWREPPLVMDAKYYLAGSDPTRTHGPIKKILGDMALLDAEHGMLFFPLLPELANGEHRTRSVRRKQYRHRAGISQDVQVHLYRLSPDMAVEAVQARLRAVLDYAEQSLSERPEPTCHGVWLDADSTNAAGTSLHGTAILCPKPHIGAEVFDVVNAETDCLKNPQVCHVIGQSIVRPEVIRVTTRAGLQEKSLGLRTRGDALLKQAETAGNEERAEQIRMQIFKGVGGAVEQYAALRGNTGAIEEHFKKWIFRGYWKEGQRALAPATCNMLVSGEYVWHEYAENALDDWAAPAIQYCRALEFEVRRRLYSHSPTSFRLTGAGWTLGVLKYLYHQRTATKGDAAHNWALLRDILSRSGCKLPEFEDMLERLVNAHVVEHRNYLAHGEPVQQHIAEALREAIIGDGGQIGILGWVIRHVDPA